ncbi:efflux protein, MATE family [human gut metagenome]|uniref:Efflux protein, MATE family n=1 Tax=human gut metagenome TaxID=408170 RepID=K1S0H9_9ZZZZ
MDVAGVALASIISQYVSAALILQALLRCKDIYALHPGKLRLDPELTKDILKLGMPSGLQNVIFQFANSFVQMGVNSFDATMVAGNSAATNADAMVYDVMAAFYTACGSFMGQNYGAGKKKRVRNSYLISLAYSFGIGLILGVSLVFFGRAFLLCLPEMRQL